MSKSFKERMIIMDFEKDIDNNEKDNIDFFGKDESDVNAFKDNKAGEQENEKGTSFQGNADEKETENNGAQEKAHFEKEENFNKEGTTDGTVGQQYSTYYTPPYYVPNFVINDQSSVKNDKREKKKSGKKTIITICIIAGVLALCLLLGVVAFSVFNIIKTLFTSDYSDFGNEELNVVQNAPQMNVTQNTDATYEPMSLPEVVSKVGNSVVEISVMDRTGFMDRYVTEGAGSGVLITQSSEAGYLLTNYHVVYSDNGTAIDNISVVLTNGETYAATIVGRDSNLDLALLRIAKKAGESFTVAQFGDSSKLVVGQDIIAIGNPLGSLGGTVTDGIISALDRRIKIDGVEMVLLQHNAAINPGNSGGALFDMMGNLVGIVNAKTSSVGVEGLGFAIPSNIAFNFLNRIMVVEPAIGISVAYGSIYGDVGLWVMSDAGEFKKYDKIIAVNGEQISSAADYYAVIGDVNKGETVTISIQRNGKKIDVSITIE